MSGQQGSASGQYNAGSKEDKQAALIAIGNMASVLITVATATLALSATFLGDLYKGSSITALWVGWSILSLSFILGIMVLGRQISLLSESQLTPRRDRIEAFSFFQLLAMLVGLGFLAIFAVNNVNAEEECKEKVVIASRIYCRTE